MKRRNRGHREELRAIVRDALRTAPGPDEPDVTRLVEAVPSLVAEARRRKRASKSPGLMFTLAASSRRLIPKLAVLTAAVLVLASAALVVRRETKSGESTTVESVIVGGTRAGTGDPADVLLDAMWKGGESDD